jgi:hypothetical protein
MTARWLSALFVVLCASCTKSEDPSSETRLALGQPVGAACSAPTAAQTYDEPDTTKEPVGMTPPETEVLTSSLPVGQGFCLEPGGVYPHGYYTANCKGDSDCPKGSRCDGLLCRAPCSADSDCAAPSNCRLGGKGVWFCQWLDSPNVKTGNK